MKKATHHEKPTMRTDEWLTPPGIIEALGPFDLDPCSPVTRPWNTAILHYNIYDNGLSKEWAGRVWCNPPYGKDIGRWLSKMAGHNNGTALIFCRTDSAWFQEYVFKKASAAFFLQGRIKFYTVAGRQAQKSPGTGSVLVSYGMDDYYKLMKLPYPGFFIDLIHYHF